MRGEFLKLCDAACLELNTPERKVPFYHDSYAVRALAVAYDLTGERKYIEVCRRWSDRMIEYQNGMAPKGAYCIPSDPGQSGRQARVGEKREFFSPPPGPGPGKDIDEIVHEGAFS